MLVRRRRTRHYLQRVHKLVELALVLHHVVLLQLTRVVRIRHLIHAATFLALLRTRALSLTALRHCLRRPVLTALVTVTHD